MNPIVDYDGKTFDEKVLVDFHYFIRSALEKKIQWNALAYFLTDLAPTIDKSRQVIMILVRELEKWVKKWENASKDEIIAPQNIAMTSAKEFLKQDEENRLASSEISDFEDEINEDVSEANTDGKSDYQDDFETNESIDISDDQTKQDGSNDLGLNHRKDNEKAMIKNVVFLYNSL